MIKEIHTERLIIRKAKDSDLEAILKNIWSDERISKMMLWKNTYDLDEAKDRLKRTIAFQSDKDAFFICLKDNDEAIGMIGIKKIDDGIYEDGGLCIAYNYQHQGYGKEALNALLKIVFKEYDGKRFIYTCFKENENSKRLAKSLGFKYFKSHEAIREYDGYKYICEEYYLDVEDYNGR